MISYLPINSSQPFYHNFFLIFFVIGLFIMIILKVLYPKRYNLNTSSPNIYLFAYESQAGYTFSNYNALNFLLKYIAWVLFLIALLTYCQYVTGASCLTPQLLKQLSLFIGYYLLVKILIEVIYFLMIKKSGLLPRIRFIRLSYENFGAFYFFLYAFLIYFFPYKNLGALLIILAISTLWMLWILLNFQSNISKHVNLKRYQIFLYLCLSEILPFIAIIGWIIFQIL